MDDKKFDEAIKVLVMLRADVIEQGKKIDGRINEQQRALSEESDRFRRQVGNIVDNAGKTIRQETEQSLGLASERYKKAVDELNLWWCDIRLLIWLVGVRNWSVMNMPLKLPKHLLSRMPTYVKGAFVSIQVKMSVAAIVRQNRERNKTSSEKLG